MQTDLPSDNFTHQLGIKNLELSGITDHHSLLGTVIPVCSALLNLLYEVKSLNDLKHNTLTEKHQAALGCQWSQK